MKKVPLPRGRALETKTSRVIKRILIPALAAIGSFFIIVLVFSIVISLVKGGDGALFADKVAVVDIRGVIVGSREINRQINEYADRDDVKAIILRIDSPGGGVGPSQEIYREVMRVRDKVTIVASMGSVAASGGYYIASATHKIIANPGTITGSIGVIIEFANVEEILSKVGLKGFVVKSGPFKDIGSPLREMSGEERRLVQGVVDDLHRQFVGAVAEGRGMDVSLISEIADGRFFSGEQSVELGLVDEIGNFNDAVEAAAALAGIDKKPHVIYPTETGSGLLGILLESSMGAIVDALKPSVRAMYLIS
ncbi:MAG: signal peptide peptidase SppA [Thermodesulfobacteriota bacterium]